MTPAAIDRAGDTRGSFGPASPSLKATSFAPVLDSQRRLLAQQLKTAPVIDPQNMFSSNGSMEDSSLKQSATELNGGSLRNTPAAIPTRVHSAADRGNYSTGKAQTNVASRPGTTPAPVRPDRMHRSPATPSPTQSQQPPLPATQDKPAAFHAYKLSGDVASAPTSVSPTGTPVAVVTSASLHVEESLAAQVGRVLALPASSVRVPVPSLPANAVTQSAATVRNAPPQPPAKPALQPPDLPPPRLAPKPPTPFENLVRSVNLRLGPQHSSAVLRLHPPDLGPMRIDVRLEKDALQIDITAQDQSARELLVRRADQLRSTLSAHGIQVDRLNVSIAPVAAEQGYFRLPSRLRNSGPYEEDSVHSPTLREDPRKDGLPRVTGSTARIRTITPTVRQGHQEEGHGPC